MARPPTGMAASGTALPSGARRNERRASEASSAEPMMNAQAMTMSGAGPVSCTRLDDDSRTDDRAGAAARRHVAVETLGEVGAPHVRHRAPEDRDQIEIGRAQRDEIHERHGAIARIPGEPRGQREKHHHERRRHEPRQPATRRTAHQPPVDGQQRRRTHQHRREQDGVVLHAHFERERFAHRTQRVVAAHQAEEARGRHQQCAPFLPADRDCRHAARSPQRFQRSGEMRLLALRVTQRERRAVLDVPALQHQPGRHVDG